MHFISCRWYEKCVLSSARVLSKVPSRREYGEVNQLNPADGPKEMSFHMKRLQMTSVALALLVVLFSGCARSPQAKRDRYFSRGMALLEKKDYGRAILEFRNATKVISTDPDIYYQMGIAYLGLKDYTNGIRAFQKALELKPNHPQAQLRMAELLSVTDEPGYLKDAQNRLNALLQGNPATPEILNTLGFTELKLGNFESAMQTYERVLAQTPGELTAVVMLARTKLMQKDPQGAEDVLTKAVNGAPQSAAARRILAEFYIERRRMPEAETNLRAALAIDPKDGAALMNLARIELTAGRKQEAEQSFRKLSAFASYESVYAVYLFQERRLDEALREFERLAKAKPDDRAARMRLIVAYRKANRPVDAGRVLAEALKKNSKDTDALVQRAEMSLEAAKYTEALADLSLALKLKPDMPEVHYLRAKIYQKRGQLLVYRQELSDTLRLNPALVEVRMEAARDFVTAGDPKGALALMDAAPEPQKRQPGFIAQRNWALWATGDMAQMRQGVDRGLASERLPELLVQDGLLRLRSGDAVRARASVEEALKIDPSALLALRVLGQTYASEKRLSTGMEKVREYASQQQKSAPVQHFLGMMLLGTGDRTGARAAFQAAKAADKDFVACGSRAGSGRCRRRKTG